MEVIRLLEKGVELKWEYDGEADALYISFGKPQAALGVDIGDGVVVRYDENRKEVVGLTLLGMRTKVEEVLAQEGKS